MTLTRRPSQQLLLGPLEMQVMNVAWSVGRCSVRDVVERLNSKLAYTTVMTTLDRLFKKGLLEREKYFVAGFLAGPEPSRDLLLSSLVDAVGQHDAVLLDELEEKIRRKRRELSRTPKP
jgi:predicted transcriptional regulator